MDCWVSRIQLICCTWNIEVITTSWFVYLKILLEADLRVHRESRHFKCHCSKPAMLGLSILLILGVLTWDDCLCETLYFAFLTMHQKAKVPRTLSALFLAYITNLFAALAHYSSGQVFVYYGGKFLCYFLLSNIY